MQSFRKTHAAALSLFAAVLNLSGSAATPAAAQTRVSVTFDAGRAAIKAPPPARPAAPVVAAATAPVLRFAAPQRPAIAFASEPSLRARMQYETVQWGGKPVQTLDERSRLLLAQAAARRAGLHEVGLSYHDVYGVIEAETSWIPRTGASKDGTPNLGLAQFEPRTARGLGVTDPSDPVQAVFGAAAYMKQAGAWAAARIAGLKLPPEQHAAKLREGVSVYYNLSVKGRNKWDGLNTADLPAETQRHIRNARAGAAEALQLARLLKA